MPARCMPSRWAESFVLAAFLGLAVAGCGGSSNSMPLTYTVTGSVHYKDGRAVVGGAVQFMSLSDTSFSVSGEINEDGSFTLYTVKGSEKIKGAPEGTYRVTVQPPIPSDHRPVRAISLPDTYRIEPKENNTFAFEVNEPGKNP
jgi:hypothetical protein